MTKLPTATNRTSTKHFFFSYSSKDRDLISTIANRLQSAGFQIWVDNLTAEIGGMRVGDVWQQSLANAINESYAILFMISENSITSSWVRAEIELGNEIEKVILPIQIGMLTAETTQSLSNNFQIGSHSIFDVHLINFYNNPFEEVLSKMIRDLASIIKETQLERDYVPSKTYQKFVGRTKQVTSIASHIQQTKNRTMVSIIGQGGMGKTALAHEIIDRCRENNLVDKVIWISAKQEELVGGAIRPLRETSLDLEMVCDEIARQTANFNILDKNLIDKLEAIKAILEKQQLLLVLDNLETVSNYDSLVTEIFSLLHNGLLLITSRHSVNHENVFEVKISGFDDEDCIEFLRLESTLRNVDTLKLATRSSLLAIHNITGGSPLALKLVVGQITRKPLNIVLKDLESASKSGADYEFYKFIYWYSWGILGEKSKMLLVDMSVFPPSIGGAVKAVQNVSQLDPKDFWNAIDQLVTMSLIEKTGQLGRERYALHQLTKYFIISDITEDW